MKPKYRRCCGIDVHKKSVTVCVFPPTGQPGADLRKRNFPTFTRDLKQLRTWLKNCKVTEIAMESTGQYWRSVWNLLEGHFEKLILVNPQHIKGLNGYKTDPKDAEWIAGLLDSGKLRGSWVPPREIRELRDLTRQRVHLLEDMNRAKNRIEQLCQTGNIKVSSVATDLFGVSGRHMLKAIVEGKHDAGWMADYARGALRGKKRELELALDGSFTGNQRWLLEQELRQLEWLEAQVRVLEQEIERRLAPFEEPMRRLITVPGIDRKTAWTLVAELGVDMTIFADAKHLASWAGLCPGNRESGGKRMSGKTRKGNVYLRRILCQAAWAATRKKGSYLGAFYRRIRARRGHQKAIMALAHRMLTVIYHMLRDNQPYREPGASFYEDKRKPEITRRMVKRLERLGYQVTLEIRLTPDQIRELEPVLTQQLTVPPAVRRRGRPCKCSDRGIACVHRIPTPTTQEPAKLNPQ